MHAAYPMDWQHNPAHAVTLTRHFAHHGPPQVPVSQGGRLLIPIFEGEDHQDQVGPDALHVAHDRLPEGLIQRADVGLAAGRVGAVPPCKRGRGAVMQSRHCCVGAQSYASPTPQWPKMLLTAGGKALYQPAQSTG